MNQYVFYSTNKSVWLCSKELRAEHQYNYEITPTRLAILDCTDEFINDLFEVLDCDKQEFVDIVQSELEDYPYTLYSN